jgi:hypothetical protein
VHWWPLQFAAFVPLWLALADQRAAGRSLWQIGAIFARCCWSSASPCRSAGGQS